MELRQIKYFVAICDDGSFSRASRRLRIAQPALSQQIKKLEAELSVELFIREPRGVRPTEAGERFLAFARRIAGEMAFATEAARGSAFEPEGTVRLGMPGPICELMGVPLIEEVKNRFPAVDLFIVEAMSGYILDWLQDGSIDLAILYATPETSEVVGQPVFREELHLITPADVPPSLFSQEGVVPFNKLADIKLVLPGGRHGLRQVLENTFEQNEVQTRTVIETGSYGMIKQLVARNHGFSILPPSCIEHEFQNKTLRHHPIASPSITRDVVIGFASPRPATTTVTSVATVCHETIELLAKTGKWQGEMIRQGHAD